MSNPKKISKRFEEQKTDMSNNLHLFYFSVILFLGMCTNYILFSVSSLQFQV